MLNIAKTGIISRLAAGLHCLRQGQLLADADGPGLPVPHQAYVDIRRVGSSGGQITMQSLQLESLILLAEANAKMRFSALVELPDVEAWRLNCETHRDTLTTSLPAAGCERRREVTAALMGIDLHHRPDHEPLGGRPRAVPGGGRRAGEDGSASPPWRRASRRPAVSGAGRWPPRSEK